MIINSAITSVCKQVKNKCNPDQIILFGSRARGTGRSTSDIDLCLILETENKRSLAADIYLDVESSLPFDIIIYSPAEWAEACHKAGTLANRILSEGVVFNGSASRI